MLASAGSVACVRILLRALAAGRQRVLVIPERLAGLPAAIRRVVLTDNHTATARLSPLFAIASVLEVGRACSVCASTRDRNRLALFAHVTGAVALGADEIVCVGGDPVPGIPARDLSVTHLIARAREWVNPSVRIGAGCAVRLDEAGGPTPLTRQGRCRRELPHHPSELDRGLAITQRVLEGLAVERTHLYPIGAGAWERMGDLG
jgi:hypothetical protein